MFKKTILWIGRYLRGLVVLVVVLLVVALVVGFVYQRTATANELKTYPPLGNLVEVDGHKMHIYCIGTGSPTVVLESGLGEMLLNWSNVQAESATFTRVCSYDRAGFGWSEPADEPIHSPQVADRLHTLLQNAGESGTFVLVGHSIGGIHVRTFAHQYPDEVSGIVLVDSSHDQQRTEEADQVMPPLLRACPVLAPFGIWRVLNLLAESVTIDNASHSPEANRMALAMKKQSHTCQAIAHEYMAANADASQPVLKPLGTLPLIVLSATQRETQTVETLPAGQVEQIKAQWAERQLELVALSSNSSQVVATESGHFIQYDQPELVIDAIRQMVVSTDCSRSAGNARRCQR